MTAWFRSWHGAPTDPKWLAVARKAKLPAGVVSAVVWALFDHASQAIDRGDVSKFDVETYAAFSGFDEVAVQAVIAALNDKGVIINGELAAWTRRQPKREDGSAERSMTRRDRKRPQATAVDGGRPQATANDLHRTEQNRAEQNSKPKKVSRAMRASPLAPDWKVSSEGRAFARSKSWPDEKIDSEGERFRDHALAGGRRQVDWEAAWRKWVMSPYQTRASTGALPRPGSREDRQEKTANAYEKLREYARSGADAEGQGSDVGEPAAGFLPFPKPS